jgi:O-antigen ligase
MESERKTIADWRLPRWLNLDSIGLVSLALFAYAGQIKMSPLLSWVPVDLTLLMGLVVAIAVIISRIQVGPTKGVLAVPLTLLAVLQLGVVLSPLVGYSLTKVTTLWTFTTLAILAPFYLIRTEFHRQLFLRTLVVIGVAVAIVTFLRPASDSTFSNVEVFEGSNTIGTARMTATGVVICLIFLLGPRLSPWRRLTLALISVVLVTTALGAGSRGPFIALALGVFAALVTAPAFKRIRGRALVAAVILGSAAITFESNSGSDGVRRVMDFIGGEQNGSSMTREFFWTKSINYISASPGGIGWGDFANLRGIAIYAGADGVQYAHNLILESFVEGGWVVGIAVLCYLTVSMVRARRLAVTPTAAAMYALLVFALFNAMVSGDINDSRLLWMLLSCTWLLNSPPVPGPEPAPLDGSLDGSLEDLATVGSASSEQEAPDESPVSLR